MRKINGMIRYHLGLDPSKMTLKEWANRWRELQFALFYESKRHNGQKGDDNIEL